MLENIIKSEVMKNVLGTVLFKDGLHLRDIARLTKHSVSAVKKELDILAGLNVVQIKRNGNTTYFYQNRQNPLFEALQKLYLNTDGFIYYFRENWKDNVNFAFVYGSFANKTHNNNSDIDLMIISDFKQSSIEKDMLKLQKYTLFPINSVIYTKTELLDKIRQSGFLKNVLKEKKIWIIGDDLGFNRFIKSTSNRKMS